MKNLNSELCRVSRVGALLFVALFTLGVSGALPCDAQSENTTSTTALAASCPHRRVANRFCGNHRRGIEASARRGYA
jgi:hypothetical protein